MTEDRAFVILASYYRKHIRSAAEIARPLHDLTKKNVKFHRDSRQQEALLVNAPVLALPISGGGFVLATDANNHSMGFVLQQWQNGEMKVIFCASRAFTNAELHYCTTRRELAAVMFGLRHYRHFLFGFFFILRTEDTVLMHLMWTSNRVEQSARYLDTLTVTLEC